MILKQIDLLFCRSKSNQSFGRLWYGICGFILFISIFGVVYVVCQSLFFPKFEFILLEHVVLLGGGMTGARLFSNAAEKRFEAILNNRAAIDEMKPKGTDLL